MFVALGHVDKEHAVAAFNAYASKLHRRPVDFLLSRDLPGADGELLARRATHADLLARVEHTHGRVRGVMGDGSTSWDIDFEDDGFADGGLPVTVAEVW